MKAARGNDLLQNRPGARLCLLGNHAIVRGAIEAGVQFYSCYPGTPSSEIGDTFARIAEDAGIRFEYSINEKVALEIAFAASLSGARSMCGMKHLGLSYACDPASSIPYVGVGGGLIIVSAGDPSAITSPNEQDQRHFGPYLFYPVLDPATPGDAKEMARKGFEFSEAVGLPILLRPTTRVCHSSGMVDLGSLPEERNEIRFSKDPARHVPIPENARRMRKRLTERFRAAEDWLADSSFYPRFGSGRKGIVASGVAYAYTQQAIKDLGLDEMVTLQKIGAYPVPEGVWTTFLELVDSVLVVEELTPFVEDLISLAAFRRCRQIPVYGKRTGHFPHEFEYSPDLVDQVVRGYVGIEEKKHRATSLPELPSRPPVLCAGCPHRASYAMVKRVFGKRTVYCNDIGCYTLGYGEPLDCCDVLLCMGSSISQASGIARMTGTRTVAFIGDSTFFHSGIPALINAVKADDPVTVVILDNFVTAMTGFQPSPTSKSTGDSGKPHEEELVQPDCALPLSIERVLRGVGVEEVYSVDPFVEDTTRAAMETAKKGRGVNAVVCHAPCAIEQAKESGSWQRTTCTIDREACNECSNCVRLLGCPAIEVRDSLHQINSDLCNGCGLCIMICNHDAIREEERARI